jgi:hypothetical protein
MTTMGADGLAKGERSSAGPDRCAEAPARDIAGANDIDGGSVQNSSVVGA